MPRRDPIKAQEIRLNIKKWDDHFKYNRDQYHEMMYFVMGEQWNEEETSILKDYKKIPMTMNKLAPLIAHLLGEQRQNTPNLQVVPEDNVPEETAEIREAIVKDISLSGNAKVVYQTAFQQAAIGGYGAYLWLTEYENENSFNLVPVPKSVRDATRCFWDLGAESHCKTDGMYAGNRTRVTRKKFAALYGKKLEQSIPTSNEENTFVAVADDDSITLIDYFERIYENVKIYQLSNGETVDKKGLKQLKKVEIEGHKMFEMNGDIVRIENEREAPKYRVKHSLWAGDYELEVEDFPSQQLPVIFVDQNSYWDKQGRQKCRPFVRDAKDAQKFINYLATQTAHILKISRYDQFMMSKANARSPDTQEVWRNPSTIQGALYYDESPSGAKPEKLQAPELPVSFIQQYERAMHDIQSCTGMYNTQLGEQGNEIAARAIDARTKRGSYNTFVPFDALNRAIACGGEILNEMIPILFDTEREINVNLKDRGQSKVVINQQLDVYGGGVKNDMTFGRYKIRLVPGPSYEGQKQENLESLQMVLQADPQLFQLLGDLYVDNLPLANHIEIKNRVRTIIPQEIIEAGKTGQPLPPKPPQEDPMIKLKEMELQFKMQQAQMESQLKMQELEQKQQTAMMQAHQSGVDFSKTIQELELKKEAEMARLKEQELRFEAEMKRIEADLHMHHKNMQVDLHKHHNPIKKEVKHGAA
jgi:portal protein